MRELSAFIELLKQGRPLEADVEAGAGDGRRGSSWDVWPSPEGLPWLRWPCHIPVPCFHLGGETGEVTLVGELGAAAKETFPEVSCGADSPNLGHAPVSLPALI